MADPTDDTVPAELDRLATADGPLDTMERLLAQVAHACQTAYGYGGLFGDGGLTLSYDMAGDDRGCGEGECGGHKVASFHSCLLRAWLRRSRGGRVRETVDLSGG